MHVEAVGGGAGLADVAQLRDEGALDGGVEVGVLEDQERGVAAQLHRDAQDLLGGLGDQRAADLGGAGEESLRVRGSFSSGSITAPEWLRGDHVEHATRQTGILQQPRQARASRGAFAGRA